MTTVEFLLKAKDEATATIKRVADSLVQVKATAESAGGGFTSFKGSITGVGVAFETFDHAINSIRKAVEIAKEAVELFGGSLAEQAINLQRLSRASGATANDVQVLQQIFEHFGISAELASRVLIFMDRAIGRGEPTLRQMGITATTSTEALLQMADAFTKSDDAAAKAYDSLKLTGRASMEIAGAVDHLREKFKAHTDEMREYNALVEGKLLETGLKLNEALFTSTIAWQGLRNTLAELTAGPLTDVINKINEIILAFQKWRHEQKSQNMSDQEISGDSGIPAAEIRAALKVNVEPEPVLTQKGRDAINKMLAAVLEATGTERSVRPSVKVEPEPFLTAKGRDAIDKIVYGIRYAIALATGEMGEVAVPVNVTVDPKVEGVAHVPVKLIADPKVVVPDPLLLNKAIRDAMNAAGELTGFESTEQIKIIRPLTDDAAAHVVRGNEDATGPTPREKEIERIKKVLHETTTEAEATMKRLDAISDIKFAQSIMEQFKPQPMGPEPDAEMQKYIASIKEMRALFPEATDVAAAGMVDALKALDEAAKRETVKKRLHPEVEPTALEKVKADWVKLIDNITSSAGELDAALGSVWDGLLSGFQGVVQGIMSGAGTLRSALLGIFQSMVSEILGMLARLAAAQIFKMILGLLGIVNPVLGVAAAAAGSAPLPKATAPAPPETMLTTEAPPAPAKPPAPAAVRAAPLPPASLAAAPVAADQPPPPRRVPPVAPLAPASPPPVVRQAAPEVLTARSVTPIQPIPPAPAAKAASLPPIVVRPQIPVVSPQVVVVKGDARTAPVSAVVPPPPPAARQPLPAPVQTVAATSRAPEVPVTGSAVRQPASVVVPLPIQKAPAAKVAVSVTQQPLRPASLRAEGLQIINRIAPQQTPSARPDTSLTQELRVAMRSVRLTAPPLAVGSDSIWRGLERGLPALIRATALVAAPKPLSRPMPTTVNNSPVTVNIQAMDVADFQRQLTSPRGNMRSAMRSVALAGAY